MRLGTIIGRPSRAPEPDDMRALREARIAAARRSTRWTEISYDLVARGRYLVSASTDELFLPHPGVVFEPHTPHVIADVAPMVFTVTDDGQLLFLDRQPGTWTEVVERRERREFERRTK